MSSVFSQKIAAVRDKIPASVLETPWKRSLLLVVFLVGAIAVFLFTLIAGALIGLFKATENTSHSYVPTIEDEGDDAFGYKPGSPYYSKPGAINPVLLDFWESHKD